MAKLTDEVKVFIIQQLAMFKTPQQVADLVKETFDIEVKRQNVWAYHPDRGTLSKKLTDIFNITRKKFLESVSDIPIANQAYRVKQLQESLDRQLRNQRPNEMLVMDLLEHAAKEVGGMFTNRREITGKDGLPLYDMSELALLRKQIEIAAAKFGTDYKTELKAFLDMHGESLKPDIQTQLSSELIQ